MVRQRLLKSSAMAVPVLALLASAAMAQQQAPAQSATDVVKNMRPVTDAMLLKPDDGDWLMWRRTMDGWGYSPLDQINKSNVKNLQVAWTWALNSGPTETTPIVHDGVLFQYNNGGQIQALNGQTGDVIWTFNRNLPAAIVTPGADLSERNMAIYGDDLIISTPDAHIIALDAKTGKVVWDHQTADWTKGWRYTSGPFIAHGKIIQGMTQCGNAEPGGCFVTGNDPKTGNELWRFYTIARPGTPAGDTWNGLPLESRFGASAWISGSYDPDTNTVFQGVAQPYPWISEIRGTLPQKAGLQNNALYSDSTLALDPDTGALKWYHQYLQNDSWDLDYVYERILLDMPVNGGASRKVVVTSGKLGILEGIDAQTGEWYWAKPTVPQNVVQAIDPKTGEKTINPVAVPHIGQTTVNCPADPGGRGWPATAYSPKTGAIYMPLNEFCSNTTPQPIDPGQIYTGGGLATFNRVPVPNSDGNIGRIDAIHAADQKTLWSHRQRAPQTSAMLPTGGDLLFAGSWDRYFRAFDDSTGDVLWQIRTSNAVNSFPIAYSVNGKEYIAVAVGNGSSLARSWASLTPELTNPDGGSTLWVFALPDTAAAK